MYEETLNEGFEDGNSKYIVFVAQNGFRYCIPQYSIDKEEIRPYDEVFNNEYYT